MGCLHSWLVHVRLVPGPSGYLVELNQSHHYYRHINYLQLFLEIELCLTLCDFFLLNVLMRSFSYELVTSNVAFPHFFYLLFHVIRITCVDSKYGN